MTPTELIQQYLDRATADDLDAYVALFAEHAVVVDDGHEYRGLDALRAWRSSVPPVRFTLRAVAGELDEDISALVEVAGDFPGSPVELLFRLRLDAAGKIARLTIRAAGTPVRTIALLTARPGLAHEAFVDYYENHHVPLIRSLAPVPFDYRRSYLPARSQRDTPADFDVITQLRFADAEDQAEWFARLSANGSGVAEDEARFLDRDRTRSWVVTDGSDER